MHKTSDIPEGPMPVASRSRIAVTATSPGELTPHQYAAFRLIYESARDKGYQPSIRELMRRLNINSPNGITGHLCALRRKGWLRGGKARSRAIRLLRRLDDSPFEGFADR
jgi:repressor LexA